MVEAYIGKLENDSTETVTVDGLDRETDRFTDGDETETSLLQESFTTDQPGLTYLVAISWAGDVEITVSDANIDYEASNGGGSVSFKITIFSRVVSPVTGSIIQEVSDTTEEVLFSFEDEEGTFNDGSLIYDFANSSEIKEYIEGPYEVRYGFTVDFVTTVFQDKNDGFTSLESPNIDVEIDYQDLVIENVGRIP